MNNIMSPKEFLKRMKELKIEYECVTHDTETVHVKMDNLMKEVLISLGYEEGVEIFQTTHKWYA